MAITYFDPQDFTRFCRLWEVLEGAVSIYGRGLHFSAFQCRTNFTGSNSCSNHSNPHSNPQSNHSNPHSNNSNFHSNTRTHHAYEPFESTFEFPFEFPFEYEDASRIRTIRIHIRISIRIRGRITHWESAIITGLVLADLAFHIKMVTNFHHNIATYT